ncbi:cytochrome c biogenesis protein CcsA [Selenomonas sp. TAMA-11512]|uniref:cytochrome c biogenesis protein CcsA n=1 Tax=Selenomonas sp. TAMA-11512 TaxID=3095337 RepID=UPI00308C4DB3|nr:cytochrome c biogenesis protein CcsA [Selenomonas sp. TAMA-11512]
MLIGTLALGAALAAALAAMLLYSGEKLYPSAAGYAKYATAASFAAVLTASGYLLYLIFGNCFEIDYIWSYSSTDLAPMYKVSVLWAGQQGSFLCWALFHAAAVAYLAVRNRLDHAALVLCCAVQAMLLILVLAKSPFVVTEGVIPSEGAGMNPLLQDPWMAIHPPLIFIGYALLAIPAAISAGALWRKATDTEWLKPLETWTAAAWGFLGAGIFVGGYWAYKVLGWGGWWGWDPVENSSLVPWIAAGILLHIARVARVRIANIVFVHLAAIFTFSLALYGTFLTRSGILGDFSVHSFGGDGIGLTIIAVNAIVLIGGLLLLTIRADLLPKGANYVSHAGRDFWTLLGSLLLLFIAILVFIGMSMPLFTEMMGQPASVDTGFYVKTTLPIAVLLIAALIPAVTATYMDKGQREAALAAAGSILLGGCIAYGQGVHVPLLIALAGFSMGGLSATILSFARGLLSFGGMIAHIGLAMAVFTMAMTGAAEESTLTLVKDEPQTFASHSVQYNGIEYTDDYSEKRYRFTVDGIEDTGITKLSGSGADAAREPAIFHSIMGDVYLAPVPPERLGEAVEIKRGKVAMAGEIACLLDKVEQEPNPDRPGESTIIAHISVTDGEHVEEAQPKFFVTETTLKASTETVLEGQVRLRLESVEGDGRTVGLIVLPSVEDESAIPLKVKVSEEPFIWLLWLGGTLVVLGSFLVLIKRRNRR